MLEDIGKTWRSDFYRVRYQERSISVAGQRHCGNGKRLRDRMGCVFLDSLGTHHDAGMSEPQSCGLTCHLILYNHTNYPLNLGSSTRSNNIDIHWPRLGGMEKRY